MDSLLEKFGITEVAAFGRASDLAARFLGHTIAARRELSREMGVCSAESCSRWLGRYIGRMAISGRTECPSLVMATGRRRRGRPPLRAVRSLASDVDARFREEVALNAVFDGDGGRPRSLP